VDVMEGYLDCTETCWGKLERTLGGDDDVDDLCRKGNWDWIGKRILI